MRILQQMKNLKLWDCFHNRNLCFFNKCVLVHKIHNCKSPAYLSNLFQRHHTDRVQSQSTFIVPQQKIDLFKTSLIYSGAVFWNSLPEHLRKIIPCHPSNRSYTYIIKMSLVLCYFSFGIIQCFVARNAYVMFTIACFYVYHYSYFDGRS